MKIDYVMAVAFDAAHQRLLTIRKNRPARLEGWLNGPGGKCDADEDYTDCMIREFREETGLETKTEDWKPLGSWDGEHAHIKVFMYKNDNIHAAKTMEDEEVSVLDDWKLHISEISPMFAAFVVASYAAGQVHMSED